jgi:hypothetical protein
VLINWFGTEIEYFNLYEVLYFVIIKTWETIIMVSLSRVINRGIKVYLDIRQFNVVTIKRKRYLNLNQVRKVILGKVTKSDILPYINGFIRLLENRWNVQDVVQRMRSFMTGITYLDCINVSLRIG